MKYEISHEAIQTLPVGMIVKLTGDTVNSITALVINQYMVTTSDWEETAEGEKMNRLLSLGPSYTGEVLWDITVNRFKNLEIVGTLSGIQEES